MMPAAINKSEAAVSTATTIGGLTIYAPSAVTAAVLLIAVLWA